MAKLTDTEYNAYLTQLGGYTEQSASATTNLTAIKSDSDGVASQLDTFEQQPNSEGKLQFVLEFKAETWVPLQTRFTSEATDIQKLAQDFKTLQGQFEDSVLPDDKLTEPERTKIGALRNEFQKVSDTVTALTTYLDQVSGIMSRLNDRVTYVETSTRDALG